jgi:flavin reductase (DIM6/NTAB) family NADH-FMN oxidoreductase RutF
MTGKDPVPDLKADQFRTEKDKFGASGLTPEPSEIVKPDRVAECPVQMEARVLGTDRLGGAKLDKLGGGLSARIEILRVHVDEALISGDRHIDPAIWSPLIYNFRHYYRLAESELGKTFRAET